MSLPVIAFHPGKEKRLAQGYLWAFRNELNFKEKDHAPGTLVLVESSKGRPLGAGFLNSQANLCFRMLATPHESRLVQDEAGLREFLRLRLREAFAWRQQHPYLKGASCKRLVFSEGDFLSGLIADQYGDALVLQFNSLGMDQRSETIVDELRKLSGCSAVVQRSEGALREKEGLKPMSGLMWSEGSLNEDGLRHHPVVDAGIKFELNLIQGQKTGFFLDQRETRFLLEKISTGRDCLDVFCHNGALSLGLAKGGAKSVKAIDESGAALQMAMRNAELNGMKVDFEEADAFKALRAMSDKGERYDLIVLDPPSMTRGQQALGDALRGYKELNLRSIKMLPPGGLLVSCSCTQAVGEEDFLATIQSAAVDAGARLQELTRLGQPEDHPRHPAMPESRYLKVFVFRKL
jgi:23S rRNA (cytosine1962-C5)-methyltransferase